MTVAGQTSMVDAPSEVAPVPDVFGIPSIPSLSLEALIPPPISVYTASLDVPPQPMPILPPQLSAPPDALYGPPSPHVTAPEPPRRVAAPKIPFEISRIQDYTDDELAGYAAAAPVLPGNGPMRLFMITPHVLAKSMNSRDEMLDEAAAQTKAYELGVRVPFVYRTISVSTGNSDAHYLVMDRVPGRTLEDLWPTLSLRETLSVAWQLRAFVCALHACHSQTTGQLHTGLVRSNWIEPVHSLARNAPPITFAKYLNWWLHDCPPVSTLPALRFRFSPEPYHVFIHHDIAPRNLMLDDARRLWVVDWGLAGFYPPFMERANMNDDSMDFARGTTWTAWWGRVRWRLLRWIVLGFESAKDTSALSALGVVHFHTTRFGLFRTPYDEQGVASTKCQSSATVTMVPNFDFS